MFLSLKDLLIEQIVFHTTQDIHCTYIFNIAAKPLPIKEHGLWFHI